LKRGFGAGVNRCQPLPFSGIFPEAHPGKRNKCPKFYKKALARRGVFASFRAPPPGGNPAKSGNKWRLRRRKKGVSEKVEENSKFPLTARRKPLGFPSRRNAGLLLKQQKPVLPTSGTSD